MIDKNTTAALIKKNSSVDPAVLEYYIDKIIENFNPQRVFVIGSVATGTANKYSDIDFVVDADGFIDIDAVIGALDIIPYNQMSDHIREELEQNGVLVYEKK